MSIIKAILQDFGDFFSLKTKKGFIRTAVMFVILSGILIAIGQTNSPKDETQTTAILKTVLVSDVASLSGDTQFSLIGTVSSQSQARIQAEASGRVTSVPVKLGANVAAGTVLATLENAAEYASLLQAEGAYEAAQAAAGISDVGVVGAQTSLSGVENSAIATYNNAYSTMRNFFVADLDEIFADPERTYRTPGVRLRDYGQKVGRVDSLYTELERTLERNAALSVSAKTIDAELPKAIEDTNMFISLVQLLSVLITDGDIDEVQDSTETAYLSALARMEAQLLGAKIALEGAITSLSSARESLAQAQIGGTNSELSTSNAQVKQALGVLRGAQANYAKTILRTPIAGTVNELNVEVGDFVGMQERIALIANNNALQITAYVGEQDRDRMTVGQKVRIEGSIDGIITEIAPAVDSITKKFEVKIGTDDESLTNGATVSVAILDTEDSDANSPILVPITAVKFAATDGEVFIVTNGRLMSKPVSVGAIRGAFVEITEGIDRSSIIVVDVRGLTEGQMVETIES